MNRPRGMTDAELRVALEQLPAIFWTTDRQLRFTASLGAGLGAAGMEADDVVGRTVSDVLGTSDDVAVDAHAAALDGASRMYDYEWAGRDYQVLVGPYRGEDGGVEGVVGVAFDITARVEALTEHRQLEVRLRHSQKMEAVGRLAGGIAHDFNNLLTAVRGYAGFLMKDLPAGPQREDAEEIHKVSDRAIALTRQLLVFGRKSVVQPQAVSLSDVVEEMGSMLGRLLGERIQVVLDLDADLPAVMIDRSQLEQVVMNLALNARDAMGGAGTLTIATRRAATPPIPPPPTEPPLGWVELAVTDTGSGIEPAILPHVFEPFFTTKGKEGTGLGLATAYGIAQQAGGELHVTTQPGEGSTFVLRLPGAPGPIDPAGPAPLAGGPGREVVARGTVLVAEDEEGVRAVVRRMLEQRGYSVLEASDGVEAARLLATHAGPIDLLLTDVVMPRMGGAELAELVRRHHPATPVLFMSGFTGDLPGFEDDGDESFTFLPKPFTPAALVAAVTRLVEAGGRR